MLVSRYAPSPTGRLHLGNLRTALLAWLQARLVGAEFVLRIEDLDMPRVREGSAAQIIEDLSWLGLDFDRAPSPAASLDQHYQSQRQALYQRVLLELYERGLVYPCYCSRKDIREAASAPHGQLPIYPGICRNQYPKVSPRQAAQLNGRSPAWRFKVKDERVSFNDQIKGQVSENLLKQCGDFVVRRSDGLFAYQLAVVVDDIDMQITDVLRGEDLLDSTCRQIALYRALNKKPPRYWHVALLKDSSGNRMAKRDGSDSLSALQKQAISPESVVAYLAKSCGLIATERAITAQELLAELDLQTFIERLQAVAASD